MSYLRNYGKTNRQLAIISTQHLSLDTDRLLAVHNINHQLSGVSTAVYHDFLSAVQELKRF